MQHKAQLSQDFLRNGKGIKFLRRRSHNKRKCIPGSFCKLQLIKLYRTLSIEHQRFQFKYVADQLIGNVRIAKRGVWSLKEARTILARLIGTSADWTALDSLLIEYLASPAEKRTAMASSFAATLELVREGSMEMRQDEVFAPLYLRGRQRAKAVEVVQ